MNKGTILVVDDEIRIRRMLSDFLRSYGYDILQAENGKQALDIFYEKNNKIDLILLDVMMPIMDGNKALKEIRDFSLVPVIMLTAKSEEYDELIGLNSGADDYITKPFSPTILLARMENVLKRVGKNRENIIEVNDIKVNMDSKEVFLKNKLVVLTPKEFELLIYMIQNKNVVLSRQNILDAVWNYNYDGDERTVDTHIKQLRAKLSKEYIKTVHGLGYKFKGWLLFLKLLKVKWLYFLRQFYLQF